MSITATQGPPAQIEAGNAYLFTRSYPDYPASLWTLAFVLIREGAPVTFAASADGDAFSISLPSTGTALLPPGNYTWVEYATEIATSARVTAASGTIPVLPNLAKSATLSTAAKIVAELDKAILALASGTTQAFTSAGQSFTKKDLKSLTEVRNMWRAEAIREQAKADALRGKSGGGRIGIQFARV